LFHDGNDVIVNESYRRLGGTVKLIYDVMEFDDAVSKAMLYVTGNTLVCDDSTEARALNFGNITSMYM
jgi:structural maintenance of chromosome 1